VMCSKHEGRKKDKKAASALAKREAARRKLEDKRINEELGL